MPSQPLIQALTQITSDFRRGDLDAAYQGYRDLFTSPSFAQASAWDRRSAVHQCVYTQGAPIPPTRAMRNALDAAIGPLQDLIAGHDDPGDRKALHDCKELLKRS